MSQRLIDAVIELDEDRALSEIKKAAAEGVDPLTIIEECRQGLQVVGERFDQGDYFLSELVVGAEIFREAMEILGPAMAAKKGERPKSAGTVVLGTVKGDIHDLGKSIVGAMLQANGFVVHDLGVDVPPQAFVDKVKETGAGVLAMSALLTLSFDAMKETIASLREAGLREQVRIMVGGGPVDENVKRYVGADAYGRNAVQAIDIAKSFVGGA